MPQPHEFGCERNSCSGTDRSYTVAKIVRFPWKIDFATAIQSVARDNQRPMPWAGIKSLHQFGPKDGSVLVVQWNINELSGLVMENSCDGWSINWSVMTPTAGNPFLDWVENTDLAVP